MFPLIKMMEENNRQFCQIMYNTNFDPKSILFFLNLILHSFWDFQEEE